MSSLLGLNESKGDKVQVTADPAGREGGPPQDLCKGGGERHRRCCLVRRFIRHGSGGGEVTVVVRVEGE